jgi:hypothetical protein
MLLIISFSKLHSELANLLLNRWNYFLQINEMPSKGF